MRRIPGVEIGVGPDTAVACPNVRAVPKNHRWSRRIGPPKEPFTSNALISADGSRIPMLRSSSSTLFARDHSPAPL